MNMGIKLAILGAGSTFTPEFFSLLLEQGKSLGIEQVTLMDPNSYLGSVNLLWLLWDGGMRKGYREQARGQVEMLKSVLVGEDPFNIERLWIKMLQQTSFSYMNAMISAVDMALYDIKGKALGVPVYELLGGLYRKKIRLYPHLKGTWNSFPDPTQDDLFSEPWGEIEYTPEQLGKHAQQLVAEGYTAMKFDPFRPGRDGYHGYRPDEIAAVVDRVAAIREAVGPSVDLMVECHGKFNAGTAIKIGKKLEQFDLFWYEEPVPVGMISMMKRVADAVNIPIAACERPYVA